MGRKKHGEQQHFLGCRFCPESSRQTCQTPVSPIFRSLGTICNLGILWLVNLPLQKIMPYRCVKGLLTIINQWFPLMRPAIKLLFFCWGIRSLGGFWGVGWLAMNICKQSHQPIKIHIQHIQKNIYIMCKTRHQPSRTYQNRPCI